MYQTVNTEKYQDTMAMINLQSITKSGVKVTISFKENYSELFVFYTSIPFVILRIMTIKW